MCIFKMSQPPVLVVSEGMPEKQRGLLERSGDTCGQMGAGPASHVPGQEPGCVRVRMCGGGLESFLGEGRRRDADHHLT